MNIQTLVVATVIAIIPYTSFGATTEIMTTPAEQTVVNTNMLTSNNDNDIYITTYQENRLNAFDMVLNGTTYTFDLPAYTTGYQVKSASSHNREGNSITSIFTTTVTTDATVNNEPLHITVNLTKPAIDKALTLQELRNATTITTDEVAKLFTYAENIDGIKQPILYTTTSKDQPLIVIKSAHSYAINTDAPNIATANIDAVNVDMANRTRKPVSIATFAMADDVVATVTVVSAANNDTKDNDELQNIVKGTAYAIAASAKTAKAAK